MTDFESVDSFGGFFSSNGKYACLPNAFRPVKFHRSRLYQVDITDWWHNVVIVKLLLLSVVLILRIHKKMFAV